jgi:hypothetical protein
MRERNGSFAFYQQLACGKRRVERELSPSFANCTIEIDEKARSMAFSIVNIQSGVAGLGYLPTTVKELVHCHIL